MFSVYVFNMSGTICLQHCYTGPVPRAIEWRRKWACLKLLTQILNPTHLEIWVLLCWCYKKFLLTNVYKEQVCTVYMECVPWMWCGMCLRSTQSLFTTYKQQLCWFHCQLFCNTLVVSHLTSLLYFITYLLYT